MAKMLTLRFLFAAVYIIQVCFSLASVSAGFGGKTVFDAETAMYRTTLPHIEYKAERVSLSGRTASTTIEPKASVSAVFGGKTVFDADTGMYRTTLPHFQIEYKAERVSLYGRTAPTTIEPKTDSLEVTKSETASIKQHLVNNQDVDENFPSKNDSFGMLESHSVSRETYVIDGQVAEEYCQGTFGSSEMLEIHNVSRENYVIDGQNAEEEFLMRSSDRSVKMFESENVSIKNNTVFDNQVEPEDTSSTRSSGRSVEMLESEKVSIHNTIFDNQVEQEDFSSTIGSVKMLESGNVSKSNPCFVNQVEPKDFPSIVLNRIWARGFRDKEKGVFTIPFDQGVITVRYLSEENKLYSYSCDMETNDKEGKTVLHSGYFMVTDEDFKNAVTGASATGRLLYIVYHPDDCRLFLQIPAQSDSYLGVKAFEEEAERQLATIQIQLQSHTPANKGPHLL